MSSSASCVTGFDGSFVEELGHQAALRQNNEPQHAAELTWIERLATDASLQAFVKAEVARAGIELDTLRWQRVRDRQQIAVLTAQLDAAQAELRTLRRRVGRGARLTDQDVE